jgi:agmatine deiminase
MPERTTENSTEGHAPATPAELGFRMPPEWAPHAATHMGWPFDDELWVGYLEGVREEFAALVATIASFEPVMLNVRDREAEEDARRRIASAAQRLFPATAASVLGNVEYFRVPLNDVWFRDNGPLFVVGGPGSDQAHRVAATDWRFNAWGKKYAPWHDDDRAAAALAGHLNMKSFEVPIVMEGGALELNGQGVCLTTRSCLLEPNRNPELTPEQIEGHLKKNLGVTQVVWLPEGLEGDHTDGHIDTIVRFTDDNTIVCAVEQNVADPNHATMARNLGILKELRRPDGGAYRVVELPLPEKRIELEGERVPPTYANFYVGNGFVVVPTYDDVNDERALDILRPLFPGRQVIGLPAENLITGGGAFHCVTQQRPAGEAVPAAWQPAPVTGQEEPA